MRPVKHGAARKETLPLYRVWNSMKARCTVETCDMYHNYGGRGIGICVEWAEDPAAFVCWALAAGYRSGLSIDRIDNDADYSPDNCRWVSQTEQCRNKRNNRFVAYKGENYTNADLARLAGLHPSVLHCRIHRYGWSVERAVTAPLVWTKARAA